MRLSQAALAHCGPPPPPRRRGLPLGWLALAVVLVLAFSCGAMTALSLR